MGYRGGKGEEQEREEGFQGCRVLLLLHTDLVDPIDVTGTAPCRGPVRHWRHAQASSTGHGVPLRPDGRRGELTRLSAFV